jgi:hypothetical protein
LGKSKWQVFEKRALGRIFGPKRGSNKRLEETGNCGTNNFHSSLSSV